MTAVDAAYLSTCAVTAESWSVLLCCTACRCVLVVRKKDRQGRRGERAVAQAWPVGDEVGSHRCPDSTRLRGGSRLVKQSPAAQVVVLQAAPTSLPWWLADRFNCICVAVDVSPIRLSVIER